MNFTAQNKIFQKCLFAFFVFGSLFPTFRVLLIGSAASSNKFELFISALPELFIFLLLISGLYILIKRNSLSPETYKFKLFDFVMLIYFVGNIIIGFYFGGNLTHSIYAFRLTYLPVLFYLIGRFYLSVDEEWLTAFFHKLLYWLLGIAIIGIVLYFIFPSWMIHMIDIAGGRRMEYYITRMTSIFWSPTAFAPFMSIGALFSFYNLRQKNKIKYYVFFTIFWVCILFSVSRGPLITFFLGLITLTIVFRSWKPFAACIGIILLSYVFFSLTIDSFSKMIVWLFSSTSDTLMLKKGITRVELFFRTINDLKHNPFGYGFGNAGILATRFFTEDTPNISFYSTDCWYLKIACETGVFGFLSYLAILIVHGWTSLKYWIKHKKEIFFFIFLFTILFNVENIVHNLPDFFLLSNFYWLSIGFTQNMIATKNE